MAYSLLSLLDLFLHLDEHLISLISITGVWIYALLFLIIFLETGLVIAPFLPGDSLLFTAGAISALGTLNVLWLLFLLAGAAILGDSLNYTIGSFFGKKILANKKTRFFKREYFDKTVLFYEKHGGKAIVLARFIPVIRTFAPFVAGIAHMRYRRFLIYNVLGGIIWVWLFIIAGYLFGNIPIVKDNFSIVILLIIAVSLLPVIIKILKKKK